MLRSMIGHEATTTAAWLRQRRRELRAEIATLEDAALDAGLTLAAPLDIHATAEPTASGNEYARQVAPFEQRAMALRSHLVAHGIVPPAPEAPSSPAAGSAAGAARAHGAPADWLDRLAEEQRARTAAEIRATKASTARAAAEDGRDRSAAALPHLYAALQAALGTPAPAAAATTTDEAAPAAAGEDLSTMGATRLVLQAVGPNQPMTASQVLEAVARISDGPPNPATIRTNLVRLRDRGEVSHDEDDGRWWLVDPADPSWRPSRPGLRVVTERS